MQHIDILKRHLISIQILGRFIYNFVNAKLINLYQKIIRFIHYKVIKLYSICYMQRDKNMTKTFDFVYATIIFSFLFFAEKNVVGKLFFILFKLLFYFVVRIQYFISF